MTDTKVGVTPGQVFAAATNAFIAGDAPGWLAHAHPDMVLEFPFAPPGLPSRIEGKAAVEQYLHSVPGQVEFDDVTVLHEHQTTDADTAIIEWTARGHIKATGAPYEMAYAVAVTLIDGLMAVYREYWNPLVALELEHAP